MIDLNSLVTGSTSLYLFSVCSINSQGEIIGLALDAQGNFHRYLATPSSGGEGPSADLSRARSRQFEFGWQIARFRIVQHGR